jgi:hypothetical protein
MGTAPDEASATADLVDVLAAMGFAAEATSALDGRFDVVIDLDGEERRVAIEVKGTPSPAGVRRLVEGRLRHDGYHLLVANHLSADARATLEEAGWSYLDREGRLRLWLDRVRIDAPVEPLVEVPRKSALDTASGRAVALRLLAADGPFTVRGLAAELNMAPSSAAAALQALRAESLVEQGSTETVGAPLFWSLSERWGAGERSVALIEAPALPDDARSTQLGFGIEDIEDTTGWVLRGDQAAAAWGAPLPLRGNSPPDFYVPDDRTLRIAKQVYGEANSYAARGATVVVAPTRWVVAHRFDLAKRRPEGGVRWPAPHPVVAALDLARGGARGREILEGFDPPSGFQRVW